MATMTRLAKPSNGNGSIRIMIADSHAMFRAALRKLLGAEPGFVVVGEAEDGIEAVAHVRVVQPHVVLLDLALRRCSGLEVLREIRSLSPATRALLLVDAIDEGELIEALCLGARGVAFKTTATDLLLKSIRAVKAGEYWVERDRISLLIRSLNGRLGNNGQDGDRSVFGLKPRELDIVRAIAAGESTQEMAQKLSRSEVTVRHQLTSIFRRLGVRNRSELLSFAMTHNLAGDGDGSRGAPAPMRRVPTTQELARPSFPLPWTLVSSSGAGEAGDSSSEKAVLPSPRPGNGSGRVRRQFEGLARTVAKRDEEKTNC